VTFSCEDLHRLTEEVVAAWRSGASLDWSVRAGTLEWSCARTADHAIDTVLAPAFFLASRKRDGYPDYGVSTPGESARPETLMEGLVTASEILTAVVAAAPPEARAVIWRRPQLEVRGPKDFVPRAALELSLHAHDVCAGLGVAFAPSADQCERLRQHTAAWPMWDSAGPWGPLTMAGAPWADLLSASGRRPLPPS
jgi:hypothetical protein